MFFSCVCTEGIGRPVKISNLLVVVGDLLLPFAFLSALSRRIVCF